MNRTQTLVPGSLGAIAERDGISIAESFLSADVIVIVDVSGSMDAHDSRGGRSRYDVACEELRNLQAHLPGKIAVVTFSDNVEFCPHGLPIYQGGGTDLAQALRFIQVADGTVRFIVISDGQPNDETQALAVARKLTSTIDCIYVGPEIEYGGARFLEELARAAGGCYTIAEKAAELADRIETLLLKAG